MGTAPGGRKRRQHQKKTKYKKKTWLCHRAKDVDQIQDELEKSAETGEPIKFDYDDDLPGGGQFYCVETGQHFIDAKALADHKIYQVAGRAAAETNNKILATKKTQDDSNRSIEIQVNALQNKLKQRVTQEDECDRDVKDDN